MCHNTNSAPPSFSEPITKTVSGRLTLTSADGSRFAAFLAKPEKPSGVGVVVLPDVRGLHSFYEKLALRLAEQGHTSLAIDYFGRTAGHAPRDDNFPFMEHIMRVSRATLDDDIIAAANYLRAKDGTNCQSIFALGFCFGGRQAFLASRFRLSGVIGFYGAISFYPNGAPGPLQHAAELSAPILGLFAGADHGIQANDISAFDAALTTAGVQHEFITYPGAPHSFFDIQYAEHFAACLDSWHRVLAFLSQPRK